MKLFCLFVFLFLNISCAVRQPRKIDINLYKQGLEIMELQVPKKIAIEEKLCIDLTSNISEEQLLYYNSNKWVPAGYKYNLKDLINLSEAFKICSGQNLKIYHIYSGFSSGTKGYFSLPFAYYAGFSTLSASFQCENNLIQINSSQMSEVKKNKNFKNKDSEYLILAVTYLSINSALNDIKQKYEKLIEGDCST